MRERHSFFSLCQSRVAQERASPTSNLQSTAAAKDFGQLLHPISIQMHYVCSVPSLELDKKSSSRAITSSENEVVDLDACLATFSHRTFRAFYRRPPALNRV